MKNRPPSTNGTGAGKPESIASIIGQLPISQRAARIAAMTDAERAEYDAGRRLEAERKAAREASWEAEQQKQHRASLVAALAKDVGPRYSPDRVTLDSFRVTDKRQGEVLARIRAIASDIESFTADGRGLLFIGSVGTGKDRLAVYLQYKAASAGISVKWVNGRTVFQQSRDAIENGTAEKELLRPLVIPEVLCISDPVGVTGTLTPWNVDLLYRVIDERYRHMRPTWMTLNVPNVAEADKRLTPPVWDRLQHHAEIIECFWGSFREPSPNRKSSA